MRQLLGFIHEKFSLVCCLSAITVAGCLVSAAGGVSAKSDAPAKAGDVLAIVGATLIDGNGGAPVANSVVLIRDKRIAAIGERTKVKIPKDAHVIDATGKFMTPGFIDTNVHLTTHFGDDFFRYHYEGKLTDLTAEAAQLALSYGVTTVRDSYGVLEPLIKVRDAIAAGRLIGPRVLAAGNIVGWGGSHSHTFSPGSNSFGPTTYLESEMNRLVAQGVGEELMLMGPEEVRKALNTYLDKGPDFIKYGGTAHGTTEMMFSPRVQEAIVEEAHKRGKLVDVHAETSEALRLALLAGIDVIQHPESLYGFAPISDELIRLIRQKGVFCSMNAGSHFYARASGQSKNDNKSMRSHVVSDWRSGRKILHQSDNMRRLIAGGCKATVASDSPAVLPRRFWRGERTDDQGIPGLATLKSMEALVYFGLPASQVIVAATKHGAMASGGLKDFGTLEVGKYADLLLLDADPLDNIANIHKQSLVMKEGQIVDLSKLPTEPFWYRQSGGVPSEDVQRLSSH